MAAIDEDILLTAIEGSTGLISVISKRLHKNYNTVKKYCNEYQSCINAIKAEKEKTLDLSESIILDAISVERDIPTAKWYLTMMGKERGYGEKLELTGNVDINTAFEFVSPNENTGET